MVGKCTTVVSRREKVVGRRRTLPAPHGFPGSRTRTDRDLETGVCHHGRRTFTLAPGTGPGTLESHRSLVTAETPREVDGGRWEGLSGIVTEYGRTSRHQYGQPTPTPTSEFRLG